MKPRIALIDYDMGNLRSVGKALEKVGARVDWARTPSALRKADAVVLPGVGAFENAMKNLAKQKMVRPLREWIADGKPFLGICLGYQLLFESSAEGGKTRGLGVFKGGVKKFSPRKNLKVPHMGWNRVALTKNKSSCMKGVKDGSYFYFVHSYFPAPRDRGIVATLTSYGETFASSVARKNLFASQFHPEKSGETGLKVLANFVKGLAS